MSDQMMSLKINSIWQSPYAGDCVATAPVSSVLPNRERLVVPLEPTGGVSIKLRASLCERIRE